MDESETTGLLADRVNDGPTTSKYSIAEFLEYYFRAAWNTSAD